ncbi:hypothetical protein [Saccharopolyspora taberi]|uniref:Amidase n=1 Tax=Saccharopolyspora taberi TaxID=60895 RepID=A0ABN3V033_9PSEU
MPDLQRVADLLAAAGIPADEREVRGLAEIYRAHRSAVDSLRAMPTDHWSAPILKVDVSPEAEDHAN